MRKGEERGGRVQHPSFRSLEHNNHEEKEREKGRVSNGVIND